MLFKSLIILLLLSNNVFAKTLAAVQFRITQQFIDKMVNTHQFNRKELNYLFSQIQFKINPNPNQKPLKKPLRKPLSWQKYQGIFITNARIEAGVIFWKKYQKTLDLAAKKYQIPAEIIVAILGIETNYGRKKGTHLTFNTLSRKAFGKGARRGFYQKELEEFLLMSRENALSPLAIKGSYAGAMGYPQFISSSYRYYAVDFDQNGHIDLFSNPIDAIGSIANYFHQHYWVSGGEFAEKINLTLSQKKYARINTNKPKKIAKFWRKQGLKINKNIPNSRKIAFIKLADENNWLTFWNFYVLTRYNHDNKYAMTVFQLSKKLKQKFNP
jgi:membrane-bound lytic murein transglycosylase B